MSPEHERQILLGILELADAPETQPAPRRVVPVLGSLAVGAAIFYGFRVYEDLPVEQMVAFMAGAAAGAIGAFFIAAGFFAERISVIHRVVDRNLIQARLRELGP